MQAPVKKVLIVSASLGSGHNEAAKAVAASIGRLYPQAGIEIVDFMVEENSLLNHLIKETYLKLIAVSPNVYDLFYRWSQSQRPYPPMQNFVARAMKRNMLSLYTRYRPDMIICTHPFPCGAAAYLRRTLKIDVPLVGIITDFSVHQLWVYNEVDLYFVAGEEMRADLIARGIAANRVYATGIPIDPGFAQTPQPETVAAQLGIKPGLPVVLIMGGGLGLGPVEEALRSLAGVDRPLQIIVVTGENAALRRQLELVGRYFPHTVTILGYTKQVRDLMAVADILITKPGALTLSEALAQALPMVLFSPLAGQEGANAEHLVANGAAVFTDSAVSLAQVVKNLLSQPERLAALRRNAACLGKPQAADAAAIILSSYLSHTPRIVAGL